MRSLKTLLALLVLALAAAACGGDDGAGADGAADSPAAGETAAGEATEEEAAAGGGEASDIRAVIGADVGGLGDNSFNDSANAGLEGAVEEFGIYLASVLEVLQPSNTLKNQIDSRYQTVLRAVEAKKNPLSLTVARRGSGNPGDRVCRILTLNDELHVVVLDAGSNAGIRPGANWHVLIDGQRTADLKILETRPDVSAALIIRGNFADIGPGSVVAPE